ncbi:hypothetical protein [Streptomyces phaeoluteigriseus]|uniref:hypothetical protein n=1 Tax=Streptomyces phaeoluteigriseus TaxID=114686 RepID=UPI0036C16C47
MLMHLPADVTRAFDTPGPCRRPPRPTVRLEAAFVDVAFHAVGAFMVIAQQPSYSAPGP